MSLTPTKYKIFSSLITSSIFFALFTQEVRTTIVTGPQNTVATAGQSVTFNCSSTNGSDTLVWIESGNSLVASTPTTCSPSPFKNIYTTIGTSNCDVTFRSILTSDAGTLTCSEQSTFTSYSAEVIVIPAGGSSCGLPSGTPVIQGTNVTIPCRYDFYKQSSPLEPAKLPISTYATWSFTSPSSVYSVSPPTLITDTTSNTASIVSNITVPVTGTVLPSFTCTGTFTFTPPTVADPNRQIAVNSVSAPPCITQTQNVQYCATTVSITPPLPANGQISAGTNFNCSSDGFPAASYTWKITGGTISTSGSMATVTSGGPFSLTCTATSTLDNSQSCSANTTISGTSIAPSTTAAPATTAAAVTTAAAAATAASGNGQTAVQGQTTVANNGGNGSGNQTIAQGQTTASNNGGNGSGNQTIAQGQTTASNNGGNGNGTTSGGTGGGSNNNIIAIIATTIPASLIFLALSSLVCYYCWWAAGADERRRSRSSEDESPKPQDIGRPSLSSAFYQAVYGRPPVAKTSSPGAIDMIPPTTPSTPVVTPLYSVNFRSKYVTPPADQTPRADQQPSSRVACPGGHYASTDALMLSPGLYNNLTNSNPNLLLYRSCDHVNSAGHKGHQH